MVPTYQVVQPESFDFENPEDWLRRFERFRKASELTEKSEEARENTLIYCMADKADDNLHSSTHSVLIVLNSTHTVLIVA